MALAAEALLERMAETAPLTETAGYHRIAFKAMGTENEVIFAAPSRPRAEEFRQAVLRWTAAFEAKFSRFLPESLVSRVNAAAGREPVATDAQADELFALCDWYHWRTGSVFDPTAGPLIELWDYHQAPARLPSADDVAQARTKVGWGKVVRSPGRIFLPAEGMRLDLGGIGKEYAVDQLFLLAEERGLRDLAVSLGRDIRVAGKPPEGGAWRIGLEHPGRMDQCWEGLAVDHAALCCSGDYRRYFEFEGRRYGHILDPRSGYPVNNGCHAAWVVAPSCTEAGVLSTSVLVLGVEEGLNLIEASHHAAGCVWTEKGNYQTRRFGNYVIPGQKATA